MSKKVFIIGQYINVDVFAPRMGSFPIGRCDGIICKLTIPKEVGHIDYGCTVLATVAVIEPKYMRVVVCEVIKSSASNALETSIKLDDLRILNTRPERKVKAVRNFPFLSKLELIKR